MRDILSAAMKAALADGDEIRVATLRLIGAAVKDRDAQVVREEGGAGASDAEILDLLKVMVRQREDSMRTYEEEGRLETAERERREIAVLRALMPTPLSDDEMTAAIRQTIDALGAEGIRDLGRVMAALKRAYPGRIDPTRAGLRVKEALGAG